MRARPNDPRDDSKATYVVADVSPPLNAGGNDTGGNRFPGTSVDTVESLVPMVANPLTARMFKGVNTTMDEGQPMIPEAFAFTASHFTRGKDGALSQVYPALSADADKGDQDPLICAPIPFDTTQITNPTNRSNPKPGDVNGPLASGAHPPAIAFDSKASGRHGFGVSSEVSSTLRAMAHKDGSANAGGQMAVAFHAPNYRVRRLLPVECERLQNIPENYTNVPWRGKPTSPNGPRYRILGNAWAVNVAEWIGTRIQMVEDLKLGEN